MAHVWRGVIEEAVGETDLDADARAGLGERAVWRTADASDPEDLGALLVAAREAAGEEAVVVLYLALDPDLAAEACAALEQVEDRPKGLRVVLEKPFGSDQRSARELNALLDTPILDANTRGGPLEPVKAFVRREPEVAQVAASVLALSFFFALARDAAPLAAAARHDAWLGAGEWAPAALVHGAPLSVQ